LRILDPGRPRRLTSAGVCRATLDYVRAVVSRDEEKVEPSTETASVINE
jgi:hypothetical protein